VMLDVWLDVECDSGGGEMLKVAENLQINCECEESGCCVLCDSDYCESH
jgi:hypothetical protein